MGIPDSTEWIGSLKQIPGVILDSLPSYRQGEHSPAEDRSPPTEVEVYIIDLTATFIQLAHKINITEQSLSYETIAVALGSIIGTALSYQNTVTVRRIVGIRDDRSCVPMVKRVEQSTRKKQSFTDDQLVERMIAHRNPLDGSLQLDDVFLTKELYLADTIETVPAVIGKTTEPQTRRVRVRYDGVDKARKKQFDDDLQALIGTPIVRDHVIDVMSRMIRYGLHPGGFLAHHLDPYLSYWYNGPGQTGHGDWTGLDMPMVVTEVRHFNYFDRAGGRLAGQTQNQTVNPSPTSGDADGPSFLDINRFDNAMNEPGLRYELVPFFSGETDTTSSVSLDVVMHSFRPNGELPVDNVTPIQVLRASGEMDTEHVNWWSICVDPRLGSRCAKGIMVNSVDADIALQGLLLLTLHEKRFPGQPYPNIILDRSSNRLIRDNGTTFINVKKLHQFLVQNKIDPALYVAVVYLSKGNDWARPWGHLFYLTQRRTQKPTEAELHYLKSNPRNDRVSHDAHRISPFSFNQLMKFALPTVPLDKTPAKIKLFPDTSHTLQYIKPRLKPREPDGTLDPLADFLLGSPVATPTGTAIFKINLNVEKVADFIASVLLSDFYAVLKKHCGDLVATFQYPPATIQDLYGLLTKYSNMKCSAELLDRNKEVLKEQRLIDRFPSIHHQIAWLYSEVELFVHRVTSTGDPECHHFWTKQFAPFYALPTLWEIQSNVARVEWSINYYANEHIFSAHLQDRGIISLQRLMAKDHILARKYNGICIPDASSDNAVEQYCWDSTSSGETYETLVSSSYPIDHSIQRDKMTAPLGDTRRLLDEHRFQLIGKPIPWEQCDDVYYRDFRADFYLGPGPNTSFLTKEPWFDKKKDPLPYPHFVNPYRAPADLGVVTFNVGSFVRDPPLWKSTRVAINVSNTGLEYVTQFRLNT